MPIDDSSLYYPAGQQKKKGTPEVSRVYGCFDLCQAGRCSEIHVHVPSPRLSCFIFFVLKAKEPTIIAVRSKILLY